MAGLEFFSNSKILPSIVGKGYSIFLDAFNHAGIIVGARATKASIRVFAHNCEILLVETLRDAIITGQPGKVGRSSEEWRRILIVVEGVYSMEGEACWLRDIAAVKKQYGMYFSLD